MSAQEPLGMVTEFDVVRFRGAAAESGTAQVATEVPLTLAVNGNEIATLSCSPRSLKEFGAGFLFTAGFIQSAGEIRTMRLDEQKWVLDAEIASPPDPDLLTKRLYTSGCGRGVMFSSLTELAQRRPIDNKAALAASAIPPLMRWLQTVSATHKSSGGVHTAALSENGATPVVFFDDIGRHTAVDKVIGAALLAGRAFGPCSLLCSGRISSEILFKARRSGIPVIVSIGSVTHQAVLLARSMGLTLAGFARGESFTLYSHPERITRE